MRDRLRQIEVFQLLDLHAIVAQPLMLTGFQEPIDRRPVLHVKSQVIFALTQMALVVQSVRAEIDDRRAASPSRA